MHRIIVDIDEAAQSDLDVWMFAEDVARTCARDGHARLDLPAARRAMTRLAVEVHSASHVRRLVKAIEAVAAKHHVADRVLIWDEKYEP
ncbi:hypothetical protein [Pinisolibacter sp.]|uniref:hypothetical protein n=1 Tax=Pinisolibacter sp. TaxID=2172024 RepID=UPI002FDCE2F0